MRVCLGLAPHASRRASWLVLCVCALACDDARSTVTAPEAISSAEDEADPPDAAPDAEPQPQPEAEPQPQPEPKPAPPPGPSCDQREAKHVCIDYGEHRGGAEPRCVEGAELGEQGCSRDAVVARCRLPATGVVIYSYEGRTLEQATAECETVDGELL